jgi:hypothetical protein
MSKKHKSNTTSANQGAQIPTETAKKNGSAPPQNNGPENGANKDQSKPLQSASEKVPAQAEQKITLKYFSTDARQVLVAGNFNGWRPEATPLQKTGSGEWLVGLSLRTGEYEYRFVVDGQWCEDPEAAKRGVNPYGGFNSILNVSSGQ